MLEFSLQDSSPLKVLFDRLLVKPDLTDHYTGSLIRPDAYADFYKIMDAGTIIGIGPKCKHQWVLGQHIRYGKLCYSKIKHDGKDYFVMNERDVLLIDDQSAD